MPGIIPVTRVEDGGLVAEVLWIDRFGNAQLNVDPDEIDGWGDRVRLRLSDATRVATRADAYGDLKPGQVGLVVDSYGLVSIAVDLRNRKNLGTPLSQPDLEQKFERVLQSLNTWKIHFDATLGKILPQSALDKTIGWYHASHVAISCNIQIRHAGLNQTAFLLFPQAARVL